MNFIQRYITYFAQRPLLNAVIVIVYYLLVVLPHEAFGVWIANTLDKPFGRDTYNLIILTMGLTGLSAYLGLIWNGTKQLTDKGKKVWLYLLATVFLVVLSFNTILVVNVEIIHFIQYAMLAFLMFPLFQSYKETLFWASVLGALDELYQYLVLAPQRTDYYDFNDVLIDMIGATLGLIVMAAYGVKTKQTPTKFYQSSIFIGLMTIIGLLLFAWIVGWMAIYPRLDGTLAYLPIIKKMKAGFWTIIHPNVKFHIVRPLEWIVLTSGLWLFYRNLGR